MTDIRLYFNQVSGRTNNYPSFAESRSFYLDFQKARFYSIVYFYSARLQPPPRAPGAS